MVMPAPVILIAMSPPYKPGMERSKFENLPPGEGSHVSFHFPKGVYLGDVRLSRDLKKSSVQPGLSIPRAGENMFDK
jgi:hypothetical protein